MPTSEEVTDGRDEHLPTQAPSDTPLLEEERLTEKNAMMERLLALLPTLSDAEKAIIEGVYFRGIRQRTIAAAIGMHEGNVSRLRYRALDELRGILEAEGFDGSCLHPS